jgi:hypothetical protein
MRGAPVWQAVLASGIGKRRLIFMSVDSQMEIEPSDTLSCQQAFSLAQ